MDVRKNIRKRLDAGLLLLTLVVAWAGFGLHAHTEDFYRMRARVLHSDGTPSISEDCPICNFRFFSYIRPSEPLFFSEFRLLRTCFVPHTYVVELLRACEIPSRGPPVRG